MASSKLSNLVDLAGGQVPGDLAYVDDVSAGVNGSKKSTLNDLFAVITKNITDLTLAFQDGAAGAVSAANQGKIRYNDAAGAFQVSINTAAYVSLATSANKLSFFAATTSAELAGVISDETGSGSLVFATSPTIVTPTIASFVNAAHSHENAAGGGQFNASNVFSAGTVPLARGGTGASLADPNADRLLGWDDTDNAVLFVTIGTNLSYDHATHTLSATGSGDVVGPAGATDNAIARFDTASGKLIQNSVVTIDDTGVFAFPDDIRQIFNPGANAAGLNVGSVAADPGTPTNGDLWYNSTTNALRARINGATVSLGAGGGGTPGGADTQVQFNNAGAFGGVSGFTSNGTNVTAGSGNLRATRPQVTTSIDDSAGNQIILLTAVASAVNQFAIANAASGNSPEIGVAGSGADLNLIISAKGTGVLTSAFPFTFTGSATTSFATPAGSNVPTKINIVSFDPGNFGQLISFGITSAVGANRRVMSIFDQRSGAHNPSIALFAPDEANSFGGSWEGSNSEVSLKTTVSAGVIRVQGGDTLAGKLMVVKPGTTYSAQAGIRSDDAARIPLIVSSEATPSVDIAQFIINDTNSAGTYTGIAKGGTIFTPRNTVTGAGGGTTNLDFSKGNIQQFTFGAGNETLTFSNIPNSAKLTIVIIQDGTGTRTLTWPGTAKFIAGVAPTLSITANARDIINFYSDGTNIYQTSAIALAVA